MSLIYCATLWYNINMSTPPRTINANGLTIKENKFVSDLIRTGSGTDAVEKNYNVKSRANARSMAIELKQKPRIQEAIRLEMTKQGLTPDVVVKALKENLVQGIGVKATAETTNRAIDIYAKLTGLYDSQDIEKTYKITLSKLNSKELTVELEKLTKHSSSLINDLN